MLLEQHKNELGESSTNLEKSFALLQHFMTQKRLMSKDELSEFMESGGKELPKGGTKHKSELQRKPAGPASKKRGSGSSDSETTVYQRAVPISLDGTVVHTNQSNKTDEKINEFISQVRVESQENQKISTSSEEFMDTSDEYDYFSGVQLGTSADPEFGATPRKTTEEHVQEIICNAEKAKAQMYPVPGKHEVSDIAKMDQNYQMIDALIDPGLRRKILNFEYIELGKLLPKGRSMDDNRMEIMSKNGFTYLSPVADRETVQINSNIKWEQAFRIFSNILTAQFPLKSTELLQYNHMIHTASQSYHLENVAAYDREFRQHISRNPRRSWSVILQQAWTIILKDRIRNNNNHLFQKGSLPGGRQNKKDKEPCRRFNRGKCMFGLSCKFDHHCSVPKCGKLVTGLISVD